MTSTDSETPASPTETSAEAMAPHPDMMLERSREPVPHDDSFHHHRRSPDPHWNESSWFGFMVPERNIDAYFYVWHRPNMNLTAAGVAIWDDVGAETHDCLFSDWYNFNPLTEEMDMFQYSLMNGMKCDLIEPLYKYRLRYDSPTCQIDLLWEGVHKPLNLHWGDEKKNGYDVFGGFHYEQFGHVTGKLIIDGETIPVDCHHIRDRSWGPRARLAYMGRGGVELGYASPKTSFCTTLGGMKSQEPVSAPEVIDGPGYGQFCKDGKVGVVVKGERRVTQRGVDGRPLLIVIDLEDKEGRTFHAQGAVHNCLKWNDLWYCHWALVSWEMEGETGWGETQDWFDKTLIRNHQRAALKTR